MSTQVLLVTTTTADRDFARQLGRALVEARLAACAQISGPIESAYYWDGQLQTSQEWVCSVKTTPALYEQVEQAIRSRHGYEEPEILATAVVAGSAGYLQWVVNSVKDAS